MIRHIVLTRFAPGVSEETINGIYAGLENLVEQMETASGFTGGKSKSPEKIERGYMHGFVIDFESWAALDEYAENPEHKRLGGLLVANAIGGIDGILVLDLEI
jgi:hypothetical protein